jgi:uncharacterized membrane protein
LSELSGDRGGVSGAASARTRVVVASIAGSVVFAALLFPWSWQSAVLAGWIVSASVFVAWVWLSVGPMDGAATAQHATTEEVSRTASEIVVLVACSASLVAVALALLEASQVTGVDRILLTAIASVTVVISWAAVHTVYALRYARLYYADGGGINFTGDRIPDYGDFAYLAFTIGMTYQVSDTVLTSRTIRLAALRHALLSFLFGTSILAMLINIVARLIGG